MNDEMRRRLEARREELIEKATRQILAENGPQDVQSEIAQIEACSKLKLGQVNLHGPAGINRTFNGVLPALKYGACILLDGCPAPFDLISIKRGLNIEERWPSGYGSSPRTLRDNLHGNESLFVFRACPSIYADPIGA